ncbi:hypothetical protein GYMLUDRAFT_431952 [Collybiopsis luxurians FD-317 M1]|uniref:DUF6534 domain-containing protein n=1 Tax=Collybiopsis luxurians FD-317 M1 TaxID=944289 RepID=A0A0D0CWC6_9AGAR|nr:hypothetical protein GYMLUDRAFT_431952 [Collybiopsis luxurians FD-317 M1]
MPHFTSSFRSFDLQRRMSESAVCKSEAIPPLHNTMGALVIGILISTALWGITCMQTHGYFSTFYTQDKIRLKLFVVFIFVLDTLHQIMVSHLLYIYLVSNYGNVEYLGVVTWSILVMVLLSAVIAVFVQLFLCWRIWILSNKSVFWISPIILIVFASFTITMVYFIKSWSLRTWVKLADLSKVSRAVNGSNFGADIAITFALVYLLRTSKSGIKRTDALMNRLMYFCLKTGLLTTLCAILSLISISVWPDTFIYITFYCALARLYANSFLATLNAREQLRKSNRPPGTSFLSYSDILWARETGEETDMLASKVRTHPSRITETVQGLNRDLESEAEMSSTGVSYSRDVWKLATKYFKRRINLRPPRPLYQFDFLAIVSVKTRKY